MADYKKSNFFESEGTEKFFEDWVVENKAYVPAGLESNLLSAFVKALLKRAK